MGTDIQPIIAQAKEAKMSKKATKRQDKVETITITTPRRGKKRTKADVALEYEQSARTWRNIAAGNPEARAAGEEFDLVWMAHKNRIVLSSGQSVQVTALVGPNDTIRRTFHVCNQGGPNGKITIVDDYLDPEFSLSFMVDAELYRKRAERSLLEIENEEWPED